MSETTPNLVTSWKWTNPSISIQDSDPDEEKEVISTQENKQTGSSSGSSTPDLKDAETDATFETPSSRKRKSSGNSVGTAGFETVYMRPKHTIQKRRIYPDSRSKSIQVRKKSFSKKQRKRSISRHIEARLMKRKPPDEEEGLKLDDQFQIQFNRTTVRKEACPLEDLNEIFAEKFCLHKWSEYFGRNVVVTTYLYMLLSLLVLGISVGLYFIPSETETLDRLDLGQNKKWSLCIITIAALNLLNSFLSYAIFLFDFQGCIPYVLHFLGFFIVTLVAISLWSRNDAWMSLASDRDFYNFFIAAGVYDQEPEYLETLWPNVDPKAFLAIQKLQMCCGYTSIKNWYDLYEYYQARNAASGNSGPIPEIRIPPSCCIPEKAYPAANYCYHYSNDLPCRQPIIDEVEIFSTWDLQIFPRAFAFLLTIILIGLSYLFFLYSHEVWNWDGEVRMKMYRKSHKSYLKYAFTQITNQLKNIFCFCYYFEGSRLKQVRPAEGSSYASKFLTGPVTHFEVWHTESGEIINVVELPPEKATERLGAEAARGFKNKGNYLDLNTVNEQPSLQINM